MKILAIDCTSSRGSVAVLEDGNILEEVVMEAPDGFDALLFETIRTLLLRQGWTIGSVDCFAAASGPGSFTGVRVGLAAAKSLAEATGRAAIGVSNLQALAATGSGELRAVVIDARRGEIYGAVYDRHLNAVVPEVVMLPDEWAKILPSGVVPFGFDLHPLAGAIAQIAFTRLLAGDTGDPAILDANYVRRSDGGMKWTD
ncbi:MAG: tRNA (adenosine(37)-N6)-threonylcarbamoyltransferase complex dimerization subunit type 1 TsaB, partial [Bryobacteraceae bacterium]|nr:tRNA (adenosine(37)-N6)-threonylcarbamoyltransferase complex dimerization subunit type 1 TsaB [Bryobacteraceae bacterium]